MTDLPSFDEARQQFLAALRDMLGDRSIPDPVKAAEILACFSSISQLVVLAEVRLGG